MQKRPTIGTWIRKLALLAAVLAAAVALRSQSGISLVSGREQGTAGRAATGEPAEIAIFMGVFAISGAVIVPPAALAMAAGIIWPFPVALAISLVGGMAAAVLGFSLSRHVARDACSRRIPERLHKYMELVRDYGVATTVVLRLLFFLFPPVNWMLGISQLRLRDYMIGTFLGAFPGMVLYTYVGDDWFPWLLAEPRTRVPAVATALLGVFATGLGIRRRLTRPRGGADRGPALHGGLFLRSVVVYLKLAVRSFWPPQPYRGPALAKRCLIVLLFIPSFAILEGFHWMALWLDEFLFPAYRSVPVVGPVFVVGIPRSGTTHLHRVLARDNEQFTVLQLWEVLFAPAICERKVLGALGAVDRLLGRPCGRLGARLARRLTGSLDDIHQLSLHQPEEDFVLLLPVLGCFLLIAAFPWSQEIESLGYFDSRVPAGQRRDLMEFYRGMLQRHLYCRGTDRILLSKNVSFTPLLHSLVSTFPDTRLAICVREPTATVPSQISAMEGAWRAFCNSCARPDFPARWVRLLEHYYWYLYEFLESSSGRSAKWISMDMLTDDLDGTVQSLYAAFGLSMSTAFAEQLAAQSAASRQYRSGHRYSLSDYGLDIDPLTARFNPFWEALRRRAWAQRREVDIPDQKTSSAE